MFPALLQRLDQTACAAHTFQLSRSLVSRTIKTGFVLFFGLLQFWHCSPDCKRTCRAFGTFRRCHVHAIGFFFLTHLPLGVRVPRRTSLRYTLMTRNSSHCGGEAVFPTLCRSRAAESQIHCGAARVNRRACRHGNESCLDYPMHESIAPLLPIPVPLIFTCFTQCLEIGRAHV